MQVQRPNGEHVTAGTLKKSDGDMELGPNGTEVLVQRATKLPRQKRSMVKIFVDASKCRHLFEITYYIFIFKDRYPHT